MEILPIDAVRLSPQVLRSYEAVLDAARCPGFETAVVESFRSWLDWERLYVFQGDQIEAAGLRLARYETSLEPLVRVYQQRYRRLDPIRMAAAAFSEGTHTVALRLVPADIAEEGYRRPFFEDRGIVERVSILQRSGGGWRGVNVARHRRSGRCSDQEFSNLTGLAQLVLPIIDRHFAATGPMRLGMRVAELETRFLHGFPELTARERQVCARAVVGMSVEATALDLDIGRTTVLTYRRRAYGRLRVSGTSALAALVLH